ncbi:MAG: LysM peptidoglycan-binding domain-containing protein [Bacteroidetes bacterium]|nr:LysM peptidoglycan-binding domain-containing protein [Bacteroidota bacterium]
MNKYLYILIVMLFSGVTQAQKMTVEQYIEKYKMLAVEEMYRAKIPASITMAQAILESGCGNSELCAKSNNHFGIKCKGNWAGNKVFYDDDTIQECFRSYDSVQQSYRDHSNFLLSQSRYSFLFSLEPNDYKGWSYGLKKAGYATNPQYAEKLIAYIEKHELYKLDYLNASNVIKNNIAEELKASIRQEINVNETPGIISKTGDTYQQIAVEYDMRTWQIQKYNDLSDNIECHAGDTIYLKPKRNKALVDNHIVLKGETMRAISQKYAIKLRKLYNRNLIQPGDEPEVGETIYLNETRDKKPRIYHTDFSGNFDEPFDYNKLFKDDTGFVNHTSIKQPITEKTETVKKEVEGGVKQSPVKSPVKDNTISNTQVQSNAVLTKVEKKDSMISISVKQYSEYRRLKLEDSLRKVNIKRSSESVKTESTGKDKTHIVATSETLYKISKLYEISVDELKAKNGLESNELEIGQVLVIPQKSKVPEATQNDTKPKTINYTWKKEDQFYKVAKKYKMKRKDLLKLNPDLDTTEIKVGQKIKVIKPKETDGDKR